MDARDTKEWIVANGGAVKSPEAGGTFYSSQDRF